MRLHRLTIVKGPDIHRAPGTRTRDQVTKGIGKPSLMQYKAAIADFRMAFGLTALRFSLTGSDNHTRVRSNPRELPRLYLVVPMPIEELRVTLFGQQG